MANEVIYYDNATERNFRGAYKDFVWSAGTIPLWYADNNHADNEGSIIYHIEKIA